MMKKAFDCVDMKRAIQASIREEMEGLSPAEQRERTEAIILADPLLSTIWKNAKRARRSMSSTTPRNC